MGWRLFLLPVTLGAVALLCLALFLRATRPSPQKQPVVVELFTSEGCSSCPPADSLLKSLSESQPIGGAEIIALEEHVDYWNSQGWKDPFSSANFTQHQQDYANLSLADTIYTPQMIIDGHAQIIGGRAQEVCDQIRAAASRPKLRLLLTATPAKKPHTFTLEVAPDPASPLPAASSLDVWIAVTEKGLQSNVTAGENSGETLQHAPVVRQLHKLPLVGPPLKFPLSFPLELEEHWNQANLTAVVFLADPRTLQIQAAGSSPL